MKNFLKIADGVDVVPLQVALAAKPFLWNEHTLRTSHPGSAHFEADDIWLRFNRLDEDKTKVVNDIICFDYPAMLHLPQARTLVYQLMARVEGEQLGRAIITRLRPGERITPHEDQGAPATWYERFHIAIHSLPGAIFRAGDETVQMKTGEVWWFDNTVEHEVINNGADDRITLIVDIRKT